MSVRPCQRAQVLVHRLSRRRLAPLVVVSAEEVAPVLRPVLLGDLFHGHLRPAHRQVLGVRAQVEFESKVLKHLNIFKIIEELKSRAVSLGSTYGQLAPPYTP